MLGDDADEDVLETPGSPPSDAGSGQPPIEDPLQQMMKDQFGNYVVQKVSRVSNLGTCSPVTPVVSRPAQRGPQRCGLRPFPGGGLAAADD